MDSKTYASNLSEAKVVADLTQKSYHIFVQTSGKAPFDIVAYRNGSLMRVQIKACYKPGASGNYNVQLRTVHTSMKKNVIVKFDATKCDLLAVYLIDIDKIVYFDPQFLHGRNTIAVNPNDQRSVNP